MSPPRPEHLVLGTMHSGHACLDLGACNWEHFADLAEEVVRIAAASLTSRIDTTTMRIWKLNIHGVELRLVWEDYPHAISLESDSSEGDALVMQLKERLAVGWSEQRRVSPGS